MKNKSFLLSLFFFLSSMAGHLYLSILSYSLKADQAVQGGLCQISQGWNCHQALLSSYAEIWNIPLSHLGFALNAFCFFALILLKWTWLEPFQVWSRWIWKIALLLAGSSVVMFAVSFFFVKTFCPVCTLCYVLSFLVLWPLKKTLPPKNMFSLKKTLWARPLIYIGVFTSLIVFVLHSLLLEFYPVRDLHSSAIAYFNDWKTEAAVSVPEGSGLFITPSTSPVLTLVEFADFLCPYCRKTYFAVKNFHQIHPDIRVEYKMFPLSGCKGQGGSQNLSCYLAQTVLCAEEQGLGLSLQDMIYTHQSELIEAGNQASAEGQVKHFTEQLGGNWASLSACTKSSKTQKKIFQQIKEGKALGVQGTPVLFVEGRQIPPHAIQLTLTKIYTLLSQKK